MNGIKDSPEYECGVNIIVYDENRNEHIVSHSGVVLHLNGKGMSYIVDTVFNEIKNKLFDY